MAHETIVKRYLNSIAYQNTVSDSREICMQVNKQHLELDMEH